MCVDFNLTKRTVMEFAALAKDSDVCVGGKDCDFRYVCLIHRMKECESTSQTHTDL